MNLRLEEGREYDDYESRGDFRNILLSYQFIKYLKITEGSKTIQAIDIGTKKDVKIKFIKKSKACKTEYKRPSFCVYADSQNLMHAPVSLNLQLCRNSNKDCKYLESKIAQYKILPILNHTSLSKLVFIRDFPDFIVICTEFFSGHELTPCLNEEKILTILDQILHFVDYLDRIKLTVSDIKISDIILDRNNQIRILKLRNPKFTNKTSPKMEKGILLSIFNILVFLLRGKETDQPVIRDEKYKASDRSETINLIEKEDEMRSYKMHYPFKFTDSKINSPKLKRLYDFLSKGTGIKQLFQVFKVESKIEFNSILIVDPVVMIEIKKYKAFYDTFNEESLNNPEMKEYYVYRLIDGNCVKNKNQAEAGNLEDKGFTSALELRQYEVNQVVKREIAKHKIENRERQASIERRASVLCDMIYYHTKIGGCLRCNQPDLKSSIDLYTIKNENSAEILRILKYMKIPNLKIKDKIIAKDDVVRLKIIMNLKGNNKIIASKEYGTDMDFLSFIGEFIEISKEMAD